MSGSVGLLDHFSALEDPREGWRGLYPLPEIPLVVLCATLAGMEDFVEIRLWGQERLDSRVLASAGLSGISYVGKHNG
jgi:hypothetical protein